MRLTTVHVTQMCSRDVGRELEQAGSARQKEP